MCARVEPNRAFTNDDHRNLLRLDAVTGGRMVMAKSLAEHLAERGKTLAVISSGSTGGALLVNPRAPQGIGVLVSGYWEPGTRVAFPDAINQAVLRRFPAAPRQGGARDSYIPAVNWTQRVLNEYLLPDVKPDVVINWITEPDHTQHAFGAGSPEARAVIRSVDREIGLLLERLRQLNLADKTNMIVVSDHGFGQETFGVDLTGELVRAGLKAGPQSDDVVIASSGQAMALHVRDHDPTRIAPSSGSCSDSLGQVCCSPPHEPVKPHPSQDASPERSRSSSLISVKPSEAPTSCWPFRGTRRRMRSALREQILLPLRRPDRSAVRTPVTARSVHGPYATRSSPGASTSSVASC